MTIANTTHADQSDPSLPNITSILEQLARLGARLNAEGEVLRCYLPQGQLPTDLAELIRAAKPSLLQHLRATSRPKFPEFVAAALQTEGPLSCAQMRIWLHEQVYPGNLFYEIPFAVRLRGPVDPGVMQQSWTTLCRRHPMLRSHIVVSGGVSCLQRMEDKVLALEVHDWRGLGPFDNVRLSDELREAARQTLHARGDALAAASLHLLGEKDSALLISLHHAVADGWSLGVILEELMSLHSAGMRGAPLNLQEPLATYLDYVAWQSKYLASDAFEHDLAYWKGVLTDVPPPLLIAAHSDGSGAGGALTCGRSLLHTSVAFRERASAWARSHDGSLYSFMLAAWTILLYAYSTRNDFVVGCVSAARPSSQLDKVVGCFMNTLPVRLRVQGRQSFIEVHAGVNEALLGAMEHQQCPVDRIVEVVNPSRQGGMPLFRSALLLQNFPRPDPMTSGLEVELVDVALDGLGLDLRLVGADFNGEFRLALEYDQRNFDATAAEALLSNYLRVMELALEQDATSATIFRLRLEWCEQLPRKRKYAVTATFTAEPLADAFGHWCEELGLPLEIEFAPWSQVVQQLLDPTGLLRSEADLACVLLRLEDWLVGPGIDAATFDTRVLGFIEACATFASQVPVPLSVWICPSAATVYGEAKGRVDQAEAIIVNSLRELPRIRIVSRSEAHEQIEMPIDPVAEGLESVMPYSPRIYTALGTLLARDAAAHLRPPLKAVVLDADDTLWYGLCAEDGPLGVQLDSPAQDLQRFFLGLRDQGVALCLCSKNVEEDVRKVFEMHPDMLIRWEHFSGRCVNWGLKSANIHAMSKALGIGMDAMIFVDDSPVEVAEVELACPDVRCVTLPQLRSEIAAFLRSVWDFDVRDVSGEGARRLQTYALADERENLRQAAGSIDEFVVSLGVRVMLRPIASGELERVSELTRRTNQFNFSGRRCSPPEVADWLMRAGHGVMVVEVADRFGDYGLTGAVLYYRQDDVAVVDSFLLSCRVLGRRVEDSVLAQLKAAMASNGIGRIEFAFVPTSRNQPAAQFAAEHLGLPQPSSLTAWTCSVPIANVAKESS